MLKVLRPSKLRPLFLILTLGLLIAGPSVFSQDDAPESEKTKKEKLTERDKFLNQYKSKENQVAESEELKAKEPPPAPTAEAGSELPGEDMNTDAISKMNSMLEKFQGKDGQPLDMKELKRKLEAGEIDTGDMKELMNQVAGGVSESDSANTPEATGGEGSSDLAQLAKAMEGVKGKDGKTDTASMLGSLKKIIVPLNKVYASMTEEEAVKNFMGSKDQEGAEQQSAIFKKFPRLALLMVRILRHPKALLGMLGILERPRIYFFGGCMLATMIMGWIWKRQMAKKNPGAARGFSNFFIRLSGMMGLRLVLFLAFFYKEAAPVLSILKKTFL